MDKKAFLSGIMRRFNPKYRNINKALDAMDEALPASQYEAAKGQIDNLLNTHADADALRFQRNALGGAAGVFGGKELWEQYKGASANDEEDNEEEKEATPWGMLAGAGLAGAGLYGMENMDEIFSSSAPDPNLRALARQRMLRRRGLGG
jgi:hypothetical protein